LPAIGASFSLPAGPRSIELGSLPTPATAKRPANGPACRMQDPSAPASNPVRAGSSNAWKITSKSCTLFASPRCRRQGPGNARCDGEPAHVRRVDAVRRSAFSKSDLRFCIRTRSSCLPSALSAASTQPESARTSTHSTNRTWVALTLRPSDHWIGACG